MTIGQQQAAQVFGSLSSLVRAVRAAGQRNSHELGAAGTQLGVLKLLRLADARPSDLAVALHVGPSVVSRAIAPLERQGLVERKPDPVDARASLLGLTRLGRRRLDTLQEAYADRVRQLLDGWTDAEAEQ